MGGVGHGLEGEMRQFTKVISCLSLLISLGNGSEHEEEQTALSGDKRCWLVEGENAMMVLTTETQNMIQVLRRRIEIELQDLGNGELKEMEFEFKNKIEFAFHFTSNKTSEELMCISMK